MDRNLYGQLFPYRARKKRAPLEDYLSAGMADLLNRLPPSKMVELTRQLFVPVTRSTWWSREAKASGYRDLRWRSHVPIKIDGRFRFADLLLERREVPIILVESKIAAPFGPLQLETYGKWLSRTNKQGIIVCLTHLTSPPEGFTEDERFYVVPECRHICYWTSVWRVLAQPSNGWSNPRRGVHKGRPGWVFLATQFAEFLEDKGMSAPDLPVKAIRVLDNFLPYAENMARVFNSICERIDSSLKACGCGTRYRKLLDTLPSPVAHCLYDSAAFRSRRRLANWRIEWGLCGTHASWREAIAGALKEARLRIPREPVWYVAIWCDVGEKADIDLLSEFGQLPDRWFKVTPRGEHEGCGVGTFRAARMFKSTEEIADWMDDRLQQARNVLPSNRRRAHRNQRR